MLTLQADFNSGGRAQWVDGIIIQGVLTIARPVGTIIRNIADGELYVSINAAVPAYTKLTNTSGGTELGTAVNLIDTSAMTITQYSTINAAVSAASAGDVIIVGAGTYTEPPMDITSISLVGIGGPVATIVQATTATSPLFTLGPNSLLQSLTVEGANGVGGSGIYFKVTADNAQAVQVIINDCTVGVLSDASSKDAICRGVDFNSGAGDANIKVSPGAHLSVFGSNTRDMLTTSRTVHVDGGLLHLFSGNFDGGNTTDGVYVENDGICYAQGCHFYGQVNAFHVAATGGTIYALACDVLDTQAWDILLEGGTSSTLFIGGTVIEREKVSQATGTRITGSASTRTPGDAGTQAYGEGSFGTPEQPAEMAIGEGDSNTRNMLVLSDDGTGTSFVNNTVAASSDSGSTFSLLQGVALNQVAYFGNTTRQFTGIKTGGGGTALDLGVGAVVWEFWDGVTWTAFRIFVTDASSPYAQKASNAFAITATADQIRFDTVTINSSWVITTVDGISGYWVRVRVTSAITTVPVLQRIKLGTNRTEINSDGVVEFFGAAEPLRVLPHVNLAAIVDLQGASPSNVNINYSANIVLTPVENSFNNGAHDGVGIEFRLPNMVDTSRLATLRVGFVPSNNTAGTVDFTCTLVRIPATGAILNGTLDEVVTGNLVPIALTTRDVVYTAQIEVDLSLFANEDKVVFALRRDASGSNPNDTFAGNVELFDIEFEVTAYR